MIQIDFHVFIFLKTILSLRSVREKITGTPKQFDGKKNYGF